MHTKKLHPLILTVGAFAAANVAFADYTYVDAVSGVSGNTTLADGSLFSPPLNGNTGLDNNWEQRTDAAFGNGANIFESGGEGTAVTENAPELRTTISGLVAGASYSIYVNFWDPTSATEDWSIRAGFTSNPGANQIFAAEDALAETFLTGANGAVLASTLTYSSGPTLVSSGGRALLAGFVGVAVADGSGQIQVFIDDLPAGDSVNKRTWYDGVSYELAPIPEPSSAALAAGLLVGFVGLSRRRRRA